jgi:hypothetical protein
LTNTFPQFDKPLKSPDVRRIALIYYPDTFQPPEECAKHAGNPHYRPLVECKLGVKEWVPDYIEWMRLLAPATRASGTPGMPTKRIWPRPGSTEELLVAHLPPVEEDDTEKFVEEHLRPLPSDGVSVPTSRDYIIRQGLRLGRRIIGRFLDTRL